MARIDNGGRKRGREGGLLDCKLQAIDWGIGREGEEDFGITEERGKGVREAEEQMDFT